LTKQGTPKPPNEHEGRLNFAPPADLPPSSADMFKRHQSEYCIVDAGGLLLLETAARAHARMEGARELIEREGAVVYDRWKQPRPHPAVVIERDARSGMLAALKGLHLDVEPVKVRK
jgi:hypothetical protein